MLFCCTKNIGLNSPHYFIMKIANKQELKQIAFKHSSDIAFEDFVKLYKISQNYIFSVNDTIVSSDNPLHFKNNPLELI